jgi:tyrosyl-tRNA synthetase
VKEYVMIQLTIQADSNCQVRRKFVIERRAQEIQEVVVKPLKTLDQIREEREDLALRETRMVTGIEVLQSPITALYQAFSRREINKRWIAEQEFKDDQRKVVKELLRLYVAYDIIDLSEEEFDDFILFLNVNETFLRTASEMELITFVQDKYFHFQRLNR